MSFEQLRDEIAVRVDGGDELAAIETEVINSVRCLGEDERAALWLFAWSYWAGTGEGFSHFSPAIASLTALDACGDGVVKADNGGRRRVAYRARQRAAKRGARSQHPREVDPAFRNTLGWRDERGRVRRR